MQDYDDIIEIDYDNEVKGMRVGKPDSYWVDTFSRTLEEETAWGVKMIQADQLQTGDHEITVCIVDSGIAIGHPEFNGANINGTDTVKFYGDPLEWDGDKAGHGTHVAGIIGATTNDFNLKIHITRALDNDGNGYESDIRTAVEYCVDAGANVINLSLGGPYVSYRSKEFYQRVVMEYNILMFAAAGNDGTRAPVYPAGDPHVISVSAVDEDGIRYEYANYGSQTELAAPGVSVLSTYVSTAAVHMDDAGIAFPAEAVNGSPKNAITGSLEWCDAADSKCKADICLYQKTNSHQLSDLVEKCISGGGKGMVVFISNNKFDTWSVASSIPVVAVKRSVGVELKNLYLGEQVTIGDIGGDKIEYSYASLTGTSMATPHAAAAAALLWSNFPDCTNHQIRYALAATAADGKGKCDDHLGYGIIKVKDAYDWLKEDPCNSWQISENSTGGCTTLHT